MFPNWVLYLFFLIAVILCGFYYNYLVKQKLILENFNSVITTYDNYNKSYINEMGRNNNLDKSLQEHDYGSFYDALNTNYTELNRSTGKIAQDIANRSTSLNNKINEFKTTVLNDSNLLENERTKIIDRYRKEADKSFANPKGNIEKRLNRVLDNSKDNIINDFVRNIPNNDEVIDRIDDNYSETMKYIKNYGETTLGLAINSELTNLVKKSLLEKTSNLPSEDLSKNNGILVRVYDANAPASSSKGNMLGQLSREYIIPSINYYMSFNNDSFFNNNKTNLFRYLEFIGHIKIPQSTTIIEFQLESGSGARLYFAGELLIDEFNLAAVSSASRLNYVQPLQKVPFKVQAYEGRDGTNSYLMLKWRLNRNGSFVAIPPEYYFLPNLKLF